LLIRRHRPNTASEATPALCLTPAPLPELIGEDLACRRGERLVFAGASFRLPAGGAVVLTGANGTGKSSLLRLVAGLLTPAAGRLLWGATAVAADPASHRSRLNYVGHQDALKAAATPREMLAFWAALRGRRRPCASLDQALAAFALDAIADWPCRWLSAGQRRRVALARLLAAPAPVWLLDEPMTALDAASQEQLLAAIAAHRAAGGRAIIATHAPMMLEASATLVLDELARCPTLDSAWGG
jgi:heme exporter protein A